MKSLMLIIILKLLTALSHLKWWSWLLDSNPPTDMDPVIPVFFWCVDLNDVQDAKCLVTVPVKYIKSQTYKLWMGRSQASRSVRHNPVFPCRVQMLLDFQEMGPPLLFLCLTQQTSRCWSNLTPGGWWSRRQSHSCATVNQWISAQKQWTISSRC